MAKIEILCRDGSPLGVTEKSIFGEDGRMGVGGAELALLTMCKAWTDAGHEVILYNDPEVPNGSCFTQRNVADFHPHDNRDVIINFRSPSPDKILHAKGLKVWWSCDQFTIDDYRSFAPMVQKIVTISPFHSEYFEKMYGIPNSIPIDLPVRTWEYEGEIEKVKHRCIFTSVPDRGLMQLHAAWPRIVAEVPDASLVITSDWRLWTRYASEEDTRQFRLSYARHPNVTYLGAVNRHRLIEEQMKAELHLYPCVYEELFAIAIAESEIVGAYTITSDTGACGTTNMGTVLHGNPNSPEWQDRFVEQSIYYLTHPDELRRKSLELKSKAIERFSLNRILNVWNEKVFNG